MKTKAQITAFIIMGVVIVLLVGLYIFMFNDEKPSQTVQNNNEKDQVTLYVEEIAKETLESGVYLASLRGGYIYDFDEKLVTEAGPIAYHYRGALIAPTRDFIERELERFLSESLEKILPEGSPDNLDVQFGKATSDVIIGTYSVKATIQMKTILNSSEMIEINDYNIDVPLRLGMVLDIRDEILLSFIENPSSISNLAYEKVDVSIFPFDARTSIISTLDDFQEEPLVYNFAVEYESNSKPRLAFIPDFVTSTDVAVEYELDAIDYDSTELEFYVDSDMVDLDPLTGVWVFSSSMEGEFNIEFCVTDDIDKDCREVRIVVE